MGEERTTIAIQRYLDDLNARRGESPVEPAVSELLGRAAQRLHVLCAARLYRSYPRLARPPVNLQATEMLSAVIERLIKALRVARPETVRQFFHIAGQHMRWELNGMARQLDDEVRPEELHEDLPDAWVGADSTLGPNAVRVLQSIEGLPEEQREVFDLVRIHGLSLTETAALLGVSVRTVQRRLSRCILLLTDELSDLLPSDTSRGELGPASSS